MVSICANYGIFIINVNSPKDLVYACYSIVAKHYARNELDFVNFKNCIRKLKNEDVPVAMLCQIPNVGLDKAKLIVKFYKNCSPQELFSKICFEDLISISGIGRIIAQKIMDNIK